MGSIENTINMILNSDSNNPGALQKMIEGITTPGNFNNLSQNFSKMVEAITNFNNKNLSHNNNVVSSVNTLMGVLQNAAAEQIAKNENDTSGTPGYMAPEVMMKQGHGIACDLFAVGVIAYECMMGKVFISNIETL